MGISCTLARVSVPVGPIVRYSGRRRSTRRLWSLGCLILPSFLHFHSPLPSTLGQPSLRLLIPGLPMRFLALSRMSSSPTRARLFFWSQPESLTRLSIRILFSFCSLLGFDTTSLRFQLYWHNVFLFSLYSISLYRSCNRIPTQLQYLTKILAERFLYTSIAVYKFPLLK